MANPSTTSPTLLKRPSFSTFNPMDQLSQSQINQYQEAFALFDIDGDGSITAEELKKTLESLGVKINLDEVRDIINEFDINGDQKIDFREFVIMMLMNNDSEDDYEAAFKVFDADGDGAVLLADIGVIMRNLGVSLNQEEQRELFSQIDQDKNGKITYDEFVKLMKMNRKQRSRKSLFG